jgi:hypothetical protein
VRPRVALFLGWLFLVVLVPASVAGVVRPRSLNPFRWALDVAATAATVIPSRPTSTPATPPKEP